MGGGIYTLGAFMRRVAGFTLIELMLVVAIIGLLAAIAIPKFADLAIKAKEAAIRGKLGTVRSAISIYYADNEGRYPGDLNHWSSAGAHPMVPKYLDEFPSIQIPTVPTHLVCPFTSGSWFVDDTNMNSVVVHRGWAYDLVSGVVVVNCTHTDTKGSTRSLW